MRGNVAVKSGRLFWWSGRRRAAKRPRENTAAAEAVAADSEPGYTLDAADK